MQFFFSNLIFLITLCTIPIGKELLNMFGRNAFESGSFHCLSMFECYRHTVILCISGGNFLVTFSTNYTDTKVGRWQVTNFMSD